ncbi:MAG TPA: GNAT family N-acetyltransferase [Gammaproteobacteria bacterium]|nr:GNAT family N-acetyltransferase [Gammaproteobacteria bacterium]
MSEFIIRRAEWGPDTPLLRDVRTRVFIEEQKVPKDLEWDELDEGCIHALAEAEGNPIGTGRLTPDGHIGRMAVLAEWRNRGVGAALLSHLMDAARERGDGFCELNAQVSAIGFYERFGFQAQGGEFMDAGIPHRLMRLDYGKPPVRQLSSFTDLRNALVEIARSSRHEFSLYAPDLATQLTGTAELEAALKDLALSSRRGRIRLLVEDARAAAADSNPLVRLAGTLPSRCALQQLCAEDDAEDEVYAFNDNGDSVHQQKTESATGTFVTGSPVTARDFQRRFDPLWERSEPAPDARRLQI